MRFVSHLSRWKLQRAKPAASDELLHSALPEQRILDFFGIDN